MKNYLVLTAASILSACGSLPTGLLDNRALCTIAGDKAYVTSLYGPVGITSLLNSADAAVMCTPVKSAAPSSVTNK